MQFFKNFARLFLSEKTAGYTMNKPLKRRMPPPRGRVGRIHIVLNGRCSG